MWEGIRIRGWLGRIEVVGCGGCGWRRRWMGVFTDVSPVAEKAGVGSALAGLFEHRIGMKWDGIIGMGGAEVVCA